MKKGVARHAMKRYENGSAIAEFGAAFYAFCLVILIPTVNFLGLAISFSYSYFVANSTADVAAQAMTLRRARQVLTEGADKLKLDSTAKFLKVTPSEEGFVLDLLKTNMHGESEVTTLARLNSGNVDRNKHLIQYRITANFLAEPILNLGSIPFLNEIPVIGKPTPITWKLTRGIEHGDEISAK